MVAEVASFVEKIPLPIFWLCHVYAMHNTVRTYGLATTVHVQPLEHYPLYYLIYILFMILAKTCLTIIGNESSTIYVPYS